MIGGRCAICGGKSPLSQHLKMHVLVSCVLASTRSIDDVRARWVPVVVEHYVGDRTPTNWTVVSARPADDDVAGKEPLVRNANGLAQNFSPS